ncbi:MAG TPA: hypothetical protein VHN80_00410, partial [Kineosporiaceae bacterium]|nr:hypothetical protein [Kineosporiaceae bacterium]
LIGDHWQRMHEQHSTGFAPSGWLNGLITAAEPRAGEPAVRRLLRGIAVIVAPGLAAAALRLRHASPPQVATGEEPAWLDEPPAVTASPDVLLLRDAYGLRFGLLAQLTTDDGPARTYLLDIDLCYGFDRVVRCGYHPDIPAATAAWRTVVGSSADHAEPEPLPDGLLPHLLTGSVFDGPFATSPTGEDFRELFRADRVAHEIFDALERAGHRVTWPKDAAEQARDLADTLTGQFRTWAADHDVDLPTAETPDDDVVRWLLGDWVSPGLTEQLALACSPHRIAAFTAYLNDDWQPGDRDRALTVLPPWARYCLERSDVTGPAAEHTLGWARRAAHDPQAVGSDHGDNLGQPVDETTVTEPEH